MKRCSQAKILPPEGKRETRLLGFFVVCVLFAFPLIAGCTENPVPSQNKPTPPGVVVEYSRTGGIAGFSDYMVVFSDGWVVYNSTHYGTGGFTLEGRDMEILRGLVRDADIPNLKDSYPAPVPGADYFAYTITVGNRTITTETTGIPAPLMPVITTLDEILSSHRATS